MAVAITGAVNAVPIVLVGAGGIGRAAHLPALAALAREGRVVLAGVCDVDAAAARDAATAFAVPDSDTDMMALARRAGARAVALAVPPGPNVELAVAALESGLHVLCEKPPARTLAQAAAMADAARARPGLVTMLAFNRRHAPLYRRALAASQAMAPPHAFSGRFTRAAIGLPPSNTAADWLTSDGSHALDLALATLGLPRRVSVARQRRGSGPDNVWHVQLLCAAGAASLTFDFTAGRRVERFEWSGADYDVVLELPDRAEWSVRGAAVETWRGDVGIDERDRIAVEYGFVDEYRAFVTAIDGGPRPVTSFDYGVSFMRLAETLLDMASGEARDLDIEPAPLAAGPGRPAAPGAATPVLRPAVLVLQNAAARRRQFETGLMTRMAERTTLHLHAGDDWRDRLDTAEAIVTGWGGPGLDRQALAAAPALRLVVVVGSSAGSVAPEYLLERGITVCTTANAVARSVAEHCLTLTLAGLRQLTAVDRQMHHGAWPPASSGRLDYQSIKRRVRALPGIAGVKPLLKAIGQRLEKRASFSPRSAPIWHDLDGVVVGLIGWGHIARHFTRLLAPFGCEVLVHSAAASAEEVRAHGARPVDLGELLGTAAVVSLHRGLTARTQGTLGAAELARLRPGTVLINTARAGLIDPAALLARLRRGDIIAALDVFEPEPLPAADPLRSLPNAILTPHNAGSTPECQRRAGAEALAIVLDWAEGRPVPGLTAAQLATMT